MWVERSDIYKENFELYLRIWEVDSELGSIYVVVLQISVAGKSVFPLPPNTPPKPLISNLYFLMYFIGI